MSSPEPAARAGTLNPFCLYERVMGEAARERAARIAIVPPDAIGQVEVVEVWGLPWSSGNDRVVRLYDFGGRVLAVGRAS